MTTLLETYADRKSITDSGVCRVYYRASSNDKESKEVFAIDVDTSSAAEEPAILAELLAIKYILLHTGIMGNNRSGDNLSLNVGAGAIKKIQKQKTTNADMLKFGGFLQIRFSAAKIAVKRTPFSLTNFRGSVISINASSCSDRPVKTAVGEIHLTRHAVERFMERMEIASLDRAWRRLSKLLVTTEWNSVKPTAPLRDGKVARTSETWSLTKNGSEIINIVIVRNSRTNRLVTVFT